MTLSEDELMDALNNVIAAQGACRRIIIWNARYLKELRKMEAWLKYEQKSKKQQPFEFEIR